MDNPFQSPVILSLCTGMRGLERGIERAIGDINVSAYVEIEAFIIENLVKQMEQGVLAPSPVWTDIKTFPSEQFHGKIHGIIGGYPCQPFSYAGKRKGTSDPRHLWPYIKKMLSAVKPIWCFFENVPGHINLGYREVKSDLEELGYTVKEGIYSAEEVGATHQRKRLFILAYANSHDTGGFAGSLPGEGKATERKKRQWERMRDEFRDSSEKMANTEHNGCLTSEIGDCANKGDDNNKAGSNIICESSGCSELADAGGQGRKGCKFIGTSSAGVGEQESSGPITQRGVDEFPAGQGDFQYSWEEPRTVEPGLGCSAHGYNFKTDLLRMYGNGVVEQTAELAFIDLLRKHFN